MFTAGLSISAPKQFTLFAVIFRPALKNLRVLLLSITIFPSQRLYWQKTDICWSTNPSLQLPFLLHKFCHSTRCISLLFLISQVGLFLLSGLTFLGNKDLGIQVRQAILPKSSADPEAVTHTR